VYPCEKTVLCSQGIRTECAAGTYLELISRICKVCPRGSYCKDGIKRTCPPGSISVGFSAEDVSFCHCKLGYIHHDDESLGAGFYCETPSTLKTKQITVEESQKIGDFESQDLIYHASRVSTKNPRQKTSSCLSNLRKWK